EPAASGFTSRHRGSPLAGRQLRCLQEPATGCLRVPVVVPVISPRFDRGTGPGSAPEFSPESGGSQHAAGGDRRRSPAGSRSLNGRKIGISNAMNEATTAQTTEFVLRRLADPIRFFGHELPPTLWLVLLGFVLAAAFFYVAW